MSAFTKNCVRTADLFYTLIPMGKRPTLPVVSPHTTFGIFQVCHLFVLKILAMPLVNLLEEVLQVQCSVYRTCVKFTSTSDHIEV